MGRVRTLRIRCKERVPHKEIVSERRDCVSETMSGPWESDQRGAGTPHQCAADIIPRHHLSGHVGVETAIASSTRPTQGVKNPSSDAAHAPDRHADQAHRSPFVTRRRRKLDPRFEGPFKVIGKSGKAYVLQDNTGALLPRSYPPSAIKLISSDPVLDSPSFEVEAILDHRFTDRGYEYLARWKGYSNEHDSWEPATNFDDEATIVRYWNRRGNSPHPTFHLGGVMWCTPPHDHHMTGAQSAECSVILLSLSTSLHILLPSSSIPLFKRSLSLTCSHISISSTIVSLATSGLPI